MLIKSKKALYQRHKKNFIIMNEWLEFSAWSIGTDLDEPPYFRDKNEECDEEIEEYWSDEL